MENDKQNANEERMFTQDEVNAILQKRLGKREKQDSEALEALTQRENAVAEREKEIQRRENVINCREYLHENGYSADLLDILDTGDVDAFKEKADKAANLISGSGRKSAPPLGSTEPKMYTDPEDDIKKAFSASFSRKPKQDY